MAPPSAVREAKSPTRFGRGVDLGGLEVDLGGRGVDLGCLGMDLGGRGVDLGGREWIWVVGSGYGWSGN